MQREDHGGKIRRRIAMRERSADRPAVTHLRVADLAGRIGHDCAVLAQHRRFGEVLVAGQGADRDRVALLAYV